MSDPNYITQLLQEASAGDEAARDALFDAIYGELRVIAHAQRRRWLGNDTLNTTALIHEAYVKLANGDGPYRDRVHFFATASKAMRQVLVNYAERVATAKRGGGQVRVTLPANLPVTEDDLDDVLELDRLLEQLKATNTRYCQVFECRVFGGMTIEEIAAALDISAATVKRDWSLSSAWLYRELKARDSARTGVTHGSV